MDTGRYQITLIGGNTVLDCIALFPERAEATFFAEAEARTLEYESSMPTSFTIRVGETSSGLMVFSSSYSSGWVLTQGRRSSEPVIINFISMGFPLDSSGLEAEIKFVPQLFMNVGYFISITTLIIFTYIIQKEKLYTKII